MPVQGQLLAPVVHRLERTAVAAILAMNVAFPAWLAWTGWPAPWEVFHGEESVINWYSSVQCAVLGALAAAVVAASLLGRAAGSDPAPASWPWMLISFGFFFLSFDEKFEFHERLRDEYLKPAGFLTDVRGLRAADVILPAYVLLGVALTGLKLLPDLRRHRRGLLMFLAALGLGAFTTLQDSLSLRLFHPPMMRNLRNLFEEIFEVWSQALFGVALVWLAADKLRAALARLTGADSAGAGGSGDGGTGASAVADPP